MSIYFLKKHVHICVADDAVILLDLRTDRYHGVDPMDTAALASSIVGWPATTKSSEPADASSVLRELEENELITTKRQEGKGARQVELPAVDERLDEWDALQPAPIAARHVLAFARAALSAKRLLRFHRLGVIAEMLAARRPRDARSSSDVLPRISELSQVFRALRPFFYTSRDNCLFDSLTLVRFMESFGVFPIWVIGVRASPFAAHSWVQWQRYVLNGSVAFVRSYKPILTV